MNDFQALLVFVTAVILISAIMIMILHISFLNNAKNSKINKNKTIDYKRNSAEMKKRGLDLINEELLRREGRYKHKTNNADCDETFVVYDTATGESFNYYEKKR